MNRKICLACNLGVPCKPNIIDALRVYVSNIKKINGQYDCFFSMMADMHLDEYENEIIVCRTLARGHIEEPPENCPYILEHTLEGKSGIENDAHGNADEELYSR